MEKYICKLLCVTVALKTIQATTISTTSTTTTTHKNSVGIGTTKRYKDSTTPKPITITAHKNSIGIWTVPKKDTTSTKTTTTTNTTTYWGRSWGALAFANKDTFSISSSRGGGGGEGGEGDDEGGRVGSGSREVYPSGEMTVNLDDTGVVSGHIPGVSVISGVTHRFGGKSCSRQAVFKVHFAKDKILEHCVEDEKLYSKLYAQRMLKIQMYLSNGERSGFLFNIGDSRTNDGYKGDFGTQSYDAEIQGTSRDLAVYGNDHCPSAQDMHYNALEYPVSLANFWIRNKYLKMSNDYGFLRSNCSECLFGLNGQNDAQGHENEDIYIGANRVIFTGVNYRTGVGLCSVKLRWVSGPFQ